MTDALMRTWAARASVWGWIICTVLLTNTQQASADSTGSNASGTSSDGKLWNIAAGYLDDLRPSNSNSHGYYAVTYNSEVLSSSGQPITIAAPGTQDTAFQNAPNDTLPHVSIDNGTASGSGGIFDAIFRHPLPLKFLQSWLGTVDVDTTTDLKGITYHGGLESPGLPVFDWINGKDILKGRANTWTYVGVCDEAAHQAVGGTSSTDSGLVTYRSFIGVPIGAVYRSPEVPIDRTLAQYDKELGEQETSRKLPADKALRAWFNDLQTAWKLDKNKFLSSATPVEKAVLVLGLNVKYAVDLDHSEAFWNDMKTYFAQTAKSLRVACPTVTLWCESKGYFQFAGSSTGSSKFTNLLTANLQLFLTPKNENSSWIKLSYEAGTDRAAPTVYNNFLAVTTGLAF